MLPLLSQQLQLSEDTESSPPPQLKPPRCPDLNLDLCISPPHNQEEEDQDLNPVVIKHEVL